MEGVRPYKEELAEKYKKKGWWTGRTIGDVFEITAAYLKDEVMVVDENGRYTWGEIKEKSDRLAIALLNSGFKRGDVILLQFPNCVEHIITYLAIQKIGVIPVSCLARFERAELDHFSKLTEAIGWIGCGEWRKTNYAEMLEEMRAHNPRLKYGIFSGKTVPKWGYSLEKLIESVDLRDYPEDYLLQFKPDGDDVTHFMPTGGTTGLPKLVPRTHNSYIWNIWSSKKPGVPIGGDVLIVLPIGHNAPLMSIVGNFTLGGKLVLCPSMRTPDIARWIAKEKVNFLMLVPALIVDFINDPEFDKYDFSSLVSLGAGGQHVPSELIRKLTEKKRLKFVNLYGMAEGPVSTTGSNDPEWVTMNTVGKPNSPFEEYRILDTEDRLLPPGKEGELAARGPGIFTGYYKAEESNNKCFTSDGFFRTGDLAKFTEDGYLVITGRVKDIIIRGGENISATEIEEMIGPHPSVADVACVAMPDPRLGEKVCAYVKLLQGKSLSLEDMIGYLKSKGASLLMLPERLEIIEAFPLTPVGKVDKKVLRDDIAKKLSMIL